MIKKESTKPKGFKNPPHLKSTSYPKSVKDDHESANDSSNSGSWIPEIGLIPAIGCAIAIFLLLLLSFWPNHSTDVNIKLDTKQPVSTISKNIDPDTKTTSYTFTYGQGHEQSMTISKDDDTPYIDAYDINAKGNFETYYIESTTDKRFKSMENTLVNADISKIQDDAKSSVRFNFNPGTYDNKVDAEDLFASPKGTHREIYLKIK